MTTLVLSNQPFDERTYDYLSEDDTKAYKLIKGNLKRQRDEFIENKFSMLDAPSTRNLIASNQQVNFRNLNFRLGTEAVYFKSDDQVILALSSNNTPFTLKHTFIPAYEEAKSTNCYHLSNDQHLKDYIFASKYSLNKVFVANLSVLEKQGLLEESFDGRAQPQRRYINFSTADFLKQIDGNADLTSLLSACFGSEEELQKIMHDFRMNDIKETSVQVYSPTGVKRLCGPQPGMGSFTCIRNYERNAAFSAAHDNVIGLQYYAIGERKLS